uniref:G-protein coupled receptors family 1 profile domain-containing protein n=1 Tax=Anolis carolinensis TaxID=28377 RepID=G1KT94_ANOCA|nr:PREDICTED: P2Y purinoceptor 1-like [Anolis carolinensis]|eukprot:XP_003220679.1 PREDICTED: P2Y purinoceptor 1-like [Anolis carolinensis]
MDLEEGAPVGLALNSSLAPTRNIEILCPVNTDFTQWFLPAFYLVVSLVGLLGNGVGLWNLCATSRKSGWNALGVLVGNLGVADLLYVVTLPFLVSYYLQGRVWVFGPGWCRLTRLLFHLNLYASIGFLTCISVHRYLGIVHPLKMLGRCQTLSPSVSLSVLVWVWVIIQLAPDFSFSKMDRAGVRCHDTTHHENLDTYLPYILTITMTGFAIPFLIITGCYCHVVVVLRKNQNVDPILKRRSITLVVLVLVLFSVCFLPYHIFRNLNLQSRRWQLQGSCSQTLRNIYVSYQVTRGLASLNSALNPLLYLMTSEELVVRLTAFGHTIGWALRFLWPNQAQRHLRQKKLSIMVDEECEEVSNGL